MTDRNVIERLTYDILINDCLFSDMSEKDLLNDIRNTSTDVLLSIINE